MSQMFDGSSTFQQSFDAWNIRNVDKTNGMRGIFNESPTASLPFVKKWEAEGYSLEKERQ